MTLFSTLKWDFYVQALIPFCAWLFVYYAVRTKAPVISTQKAAGETIISILRTEMQARPGQKVKIYDLGSGWGGLCLAVAKSFPDAEIVGLEMAWPAWLFSFLRMKWSGLKNLRFRCCNFWKHDIGDGDVVLSYLGDAIQPPLAAKLREQHRPGRLVISNTFPLPKDWVPFQRVPTAAWLSKEILLYRQ
jgi:hypothetical protein